MNKLNVLVLILTTIALSACGKSAAEKAAEALSLGGGAGGGGGNQVTPPAPAAAKWTGPGSMKMTGMPEMACAAVTVEILEDASGFELKKFSYDCSGTTAEMDSIRLALRDGELFLGADKVGKKQENVTEFELKDPSGATLGFRFAADGTNLNTIHKMKANGFEQVLTATLHK